MLAIRFQRVGRKGHAEFRLVVQESRRSPSSGNIVAQIGHFNPHSKATTLDAEKATFYLTNGAQPSPRAAMLMQKEGVKLPSWVKIDTSKQRVVKKSDKLRRNRPAAVVVAEEPVVTAAEPETVDVAAPAEAAVETPAAEEPTTETAA